MAIPSDQLEHRKRLGKAVSAWMRINGFSQQNIHDWASAAGTNGPWNSSISLLQRGKLDCKGQFWVAFGQLNKDLADGNLNYITDRRLKDKLKEAQPFLTEEGRPATAGDLFCMFIGEKAPNHLYDKPQELSTEDAERLNQQYRDCFRQLAIDLMLPPKEAWAVIEPHCKTLGMTSNQVDFMRQVLIGFADYSADDLMELTTGVGQKPAPEEALDMAK